jgi:hypothetical protein
MRSEAVYPGELPIGLNTLLSLGPPFTFSRPLAARCRVSTYVPPYRPTRVPSRRSSVQCGRGCHPGELPWGSHAPVVMALFTFSLYLRPGFKPLHVQVLGPAVEDEGDGLPGKLSRTQHDAILLPGPRHAAVAASPSTSSLNVSGVSHIIILCTQAVGVGSVKAAERPADLAQVHFNY